MQLVWTSATAATGVAHIEGGVEVGGCEASEEVAIASFKATVLLNYYQLLSFFFKSFV
jgi:hypothetical protein